jgi:hypothetical protein
MNEPGDDSGRRAAVDAGTVVTRSGLTQSHRGAKGRNTRKAVLGGVERLERRATIPGERRDEDWTANLR